MAYNPGFRRYALWSGYRMDPDTFIRFSSTLPNQPGRVDVLKKGPGRDPPLFLDYTGRYNSWRQRMSPKDAVCAPLIQHECSEPAQLPQDMQQQDATRQGVLHIFFLIRWGPCEGPHRLDESNREAFAVEKDADRTFLRKFIDIVKKSGGELEEKDLGFGYIQALCPYSDPYSDYMYLEPERRSYP